IKPGSIGLKLTSQLRHGHAGAVDMNVRYRIAVELHETPGVVRSALGGSERHLAPQVTTPRQEVGVLRKAPPAPARPAPSTDAETASTTSTDLMFTPRPPAAGAETAPASGTDTTPARGADSSSETGIETDSATGAETDSVTGAETDAATTPDTDPAERRPNKPRKEPPRASVATVLGRVTLTAPRESLVPPLQQPERAPVVTIHKEKPDISGQQLDPREGVHIHAEGSMLMDIIRKVVMAQMGARPLAPGEVTLEQLEWARNQISDYT